MPDPAPLNTPVAFLVFNRPDVTARVFEAIRRARPPVLLVVADGPRADRPGEAERCEATRRAAQAVDWPCRVLTDFADRNLGCRRRIASGLTWVFEQVEEAIIVEDDCLPEPTFFPYCEELLARYRDDRRVFMISGDNFQGGRRRGDDSYYFSRYAHIWGWATWRRSWRAYDVDMPLWPRVRDGGWLRDALGDDAAVQYWTRIFDQVHGGQIDTWDYQLQFAQWTNHGLTAIPNVNLVSNLGFRADATHTHARTGQAEMPTAPVEFPLRHPAFVIRNAAADDATDRQFFRLPGLATRVRRKLLGFAGR